MNRSAFERYLRSQGCVLHHHGGRHDVWLNPRTMTRAPLPRHPTVKRGIIRIVCKQLGIPAPSGI